ncbi:MAG: hypothetical protein OWR62_01470 [Sulfobacillus thermotolerans]|nr:hypothetical protein [Sulfobacillus thermotolerans]
MMVVWGKKSFSSKAPSPGIADALKPPLQSFVSLQTLDEPQAQTWTSRLIRRDGVYDYLDALRDRRGDVVQGWSLQGQPMRLYWGQDRYLWQYKVQIIMVLDPLPAVQVTYLEPPVRTNRRREWRSDDNGYHMRGRVQVCEDVGVAETSAWTTVSRDFSYSGIRFFSPMVLPIGSHVTTQWQWDQPGEFQGRLQIVRLDTGRAQYREAEGVNVVGLWDPALEGEQANAWQAFCLHHRYR